jgi:CRP/FNR family transcriptional regulator, cyclic AMP receptor protein
MSSGSGPALFRFEQDAEPFAAGRPIFRVGDPGAAMYGVKEGEVDIIVNGKVLETVGPGGFFGEMALIDKQPRSAGATAKNDCKLVRIDERRFQYLVQQTPFFALQLMRVLVRRLRQMDTEV